MIEYVTTWSELHVKGNSKFLLDGRFGTGGGFMEYSSGQFAKLMGMSLDTLRYYEKEGLFMPSRKENNHRTYTDGDISWMQFIKRLKETGMPIKEIRKYARLRSEGAATMGERMRMLARHRNSLDEKIGQLKTHREKLVEKIEYYKNQIERTNFFQK